MRVYLDTNVLISAFGTRGLCTDVLGVVLAEHKLVVGNAVLSEVRRILRKKLGFSIGGAVEVERLLRQGAVIVPEAPKLNVPVRDLDDLAILSEAVAGRADVLVTGDRDLLDLGTDAPLPIVTPRKFWEMLRGD